MRSDLLNKDFNLLRFLIKGRKSGYLLVVTSNYIRTLSFQQLTGPTIKIKNKVDTSLYADLHVF